MKYFPFLRGRQSEMMALRELAGKIADDGFVIPIIEPVKDNSTTLKSIEQFIEEEMVFLLICNPRHGDFVEDNDLLVDSDLGDVLQDYSGWIPTLCVDTSTTVEGYDEFLAEYCFWDLALIYYGKPIKDVLNEIKRTEIEYHIFFDKHRMLTSYKESIPKENRVDIQDPFNKTKNEKYPQGRQSFTDMNTREGNPENINFGDFSIVGDHFFETGGAPHTIALHHIHLARNSYSLEISHFLSDRKKFRTDAPGKTLEAIDHLVDELPGLYPNDTSVCREYREMQKERIRRNPAYMKRLAIKHHLEVMMTDRVLDLKF